MKVIKVPTLDTLVSRANYEAGLLERLVHDHGPWAVQWGSVIEDAVREVSDTSVTITATFHPVFSFLPNQPNTVVLLCDGDSLAVREVEPPDSGAFTVVWVVSVEESF